MIHVRILLVSIALDSVEGRVWAASAAIEARECQHSLRAFGSLVGW